MKSQNKKSKKRFTSPKEKIVKDGAPKKKLKPLPKEKYKKQDIDEEEIEDVDEEYED
jgi:hypothetical protein